MSLQKSRPTVVLVIDKSSSMEAWKDMINERLVPLIAKFNSGAIPANLGTCYFNQRRDPISWENYPPYAPYGDTNIYGSCVEVLADIRQNFDAGDRVLTILVTDGHHNNNGGRAYQPKDVANEVNIAEELLGWDFLFLGTNQDAYKVGAQLGIKPGKTLSFANSQNGFSAMLDNVDGIITKWVGGGLSHDADFFSEQDRKRQASLGATGRVAI